MSTPEDLLARLRETGVLPATTRDILRRLKTPRDQRTHLKRHLRTLVRAGDLVELRGQRLALPGGDDTSAGRFTRHPSGYGFVTPDAAASRGGEDIFIPAHAVADAMHGDRVLVVPERQTARGIEGRIARVLARGQHTVVGRFERDGRGRGYLVPFDPRIGDPVEIPPDRTRAAEPGEMVVAAITRWPTPLAGAAADVTRVLGPEDAPGVDTEVIIHKFEIPDAHGAEAVAEAVRLGQTVKAADIAGRTDFRSWPTVTIDGEHARDFDDAITLERLPNGHYWLGVHIADVSHYVAEGSALDEEAYERGTSVYFPERAVHMFPPELATGLCSLRPQVDRLVQSCLMEVDAAGTVVRYELHDGVIHSNERMTYSAVNAILTDRDPEQRARYAALVPLFELMGELFTVLNARRRRRGAIDFDLPEADVVLDLDGVIEAIVASERNVAHRLIEEFMLLANETVAAHLEASDIPAMYRVHEPPDAKKVLDFQEFISTLGYSLADSGEHVRPRHFQTLVERIHGTPEERPIAALMLRTMQKARYDAQPLGHFGLATAHYAHFTSPIRRYPDLVVHRMVRAGRAGLSAEQRQELQDELPEAARHLSSRERRADEAERELLQWKKVRFMADKVGEVFRGYITGVAAFGLFIELQEHYVEGRVHVSTMADDYYRYIEDHHVLRGERHGRIFRLGDDVEVQVIRVDQERRQIDLGISDVLEAVRRTSGPRHERGGTRTKQERRKAQRPGRKERKAARAAGSPPRKRRR
ncbi:MAG: ribonuclease R [Vicinamibacterales bacterium]